MGEAVKLWKQAAEKNYGPAQLNLGTVYEQGQGGIDRDDKEASKWYLKAAQNGEAEAQNSIANMYAGGRGVGRNPQEAIKWYKAAVGKGYAPAFAGYGALYERGDGVPKDAIKAHMFFNVAAATSSGKVADAAGAERDRLTKAMKPEDVAKARALARACMSSNYAKCD
jgi:TPR repeat protein